MSPVRDDLTALLAVLPVTLKQALEEEELAKTLSKRLKPEAEKKS